MESYSCLSGLCPKDFQAVVRYEDQQEKRCSSINVTQYQSGNQKGQSRETGNMTRKNKTKTQHNMCWTHLYANKHKQRTQDRRPPTNKHKQRKQDRRPPTNKHKQRK